MHRDNEIDLFRFVRSGPGWARWFNVLVLCWSIQWVIDNESQKRKIKLCHINGFTIRVVIQSGIQYFKYTLVTNSFFNFWEIEFPNLVQIAANTVPAWWRLKMLRALSRSVGVKSRFAGLVSLEKWRTRPQYVSWSNCDSVRRVRKRKHVPRDKRPVIVKIRNVPVQFSNPAL